MLGLACVSPDMRKVVLALVAAFSALAAPAYAAEATLSAASPSHTWEASNLFGFGPGAAVSFGAARCTPVYQCDNEHIEVKDTGTLTVDIKAGSGSNDLDVRLFKSDEAGTAPGSPQIDEGATTPIAADERTEPDARIVVKNLKPGFYVIQVAVYNAQAGSYNGTANLAVPAPSVPDPAPVTTAPVQSSPTAADNRAAEAKRKKRLASCNKKAKKVKNKKKRKAAQKKCARRYGKKRV